MITIESLFKTLNSTNGEIENYLPISSSLHSEYVPLFAGSSGEILSSNKGRVIKYNLFRRKSPTEVKPSNFQYALSNYWNSKVEFRNGRVYFLNKHCVYHFENNDVTNVPIILWVMVVKADHFFQVNFENPDLSKIVLIVNNELLKPEHKVVKLKFNAYLKDVQKLGIDVMYTNNINRRIFANAFEIPQFKTVNEMKLHLESIKQEMIKIHNPHTIFNFDKPKPLINYDF